MNTLIVFGEGETERRLMDKFWRQVFPQWGALDFRSSGGRDELVNKLIAALGPELAQPVQCVILADLDAGDTLQSVQQRIANGLRRMLAERRYLDDGIAFSPVAGLANVLLFARRLPPGHELRIVLHIAQAPPTLPALGLSFQNAATDDYILATALIESVAERFAHEAGLTGAVLNRKVTAEIPELLRANGVASLEAKDLIGIYMAVARFLKVKRTEGRERFADFVIDRALKYARPEFNSIFSSLVVALRTATAQESV
ncbi:MAG: hypothetical protein FJ011_15305 [Chloroflexi bacterium]|nr:hypothetical protein [Chloroflexota bacterium]